MGEIISLTAKGSFNKLGNKLERMSRGDIFFVLANYGQMGVNALASATPVDSSLTAASWSYIVRKSGSVYEIVWSNSHVEDGVPIAIILQYGHGTGTGGYVAGRDYINPAIQPIFEKIKAEVFKAVKSA